MSTAPFFQQVLNSPRISAATLLKALVTFEHVVYLQDVSCPTIVFQPEKYAVVKNQDIVFFEKNINNTYQACTSALSEWLTFTSSNEVKKGFCGGYVGFVSYDFAAQQQVNVQTKKQPELFLGEFRQYLQYTTDGWTLFSQLTDAKETYKFIEQCLQNTPAQADFILQHPLKARWEKSAYQHAFQHVQDYILAGDCYQINLTQEFVGQAQGSLLDCAEALWQLTDAPYAGYLRIDDLEILSCSPELFIEFAENRKIITRPIKGTMPRYADPQLDEASKQQLIHSKKDQAENLMIVDLLRNDLSVYAEVGSVKTPKLFAIESFKQVHHMVSDVEATLKTDINPFDVLMTALPGGSITGAPKIRAMQIIDELEGAPRGAYCGSMGYFNDDGSGAWNILIRSVQKHQEQVSLWAGGGITIASDCDAEYQECFDKVEAMLNLLNTWYTPE